jgi:hypothetical protein
MLLSSGWVEYSKAQFTQEKLKTIGEGSPIVTQYRAGRLSEDPSCIQIWQLIGKTIR